MINEFEQNFYLRHIKADVTELVNFLLDELDYSDLHGLKSYVNYAECQRELDEDETLQYSYSEHSDGYIYLHLGGETSCHKDMRDITLELMDYYSIPLSNYTYKINCYVAVGETFASYLRELDEVVINYKGLNIWGTYKRSKNQPLSNLFRVQEFLEKST